VVQAQITAGCGNNNYCPDTLATRKVIAIFIIKGRNLPPSTAPYNAYFDDIANDEYAPFINAMYENQISVGCGPRAYCPDGNATRAQLPVMIVNALQETPSTAAYNAYFDDIANDAYAPFINRVFELAINAGCGTRLFCPTTNVDRAQLAVSTAEAFLWN